MTPGFRVYLVDHHDGRATAMLMRSVARCFEGPPPSAYGRDPDDALARLEPEARALLRRGGDDLARYLWIERFRTERVQVDVHPQSSVEGQAVVGKRCIPLRLTYAWSEMESGAFRVMLPRYDWWLVAEALELVPEVLGQAVASALLGEDPRWIYDFRSEGSERVVEWMPDGADRGLERDPDATDSPTLEAVAEDWVAMARRHRLPPLVGGIEAVEAHAALFRRDPPRSVVLVGEPGTGKTTWARNLARHLLRRARDHDLVPTLWASSAERILSGVRYIGEWQARVLDIASELAEDGDLLFVDRLLPIVRAQHSGASIGDMLLPGLQAEEFALVAECTPAEWVRCRQLAPRLTSLLKPIEIEETPLAAMPALLGHYQRRRKLPFQLHEEASGRLVRHLDQLHRSARFPGKGFAFLDWLGAEGKAKGELYPTDASAAFARWSGLPEELVADDRPADAETIAGRLREGVVGQDAACTIAAGVLARFKAGLDDPERPLGSLLFTGTTGVGKTELAKQLARYLFGDEKRMVRVDMSELQAPGSARRLLAVGRGVQSLAVRLRSQPLSLVLFDEVEKAHPEVFDVLLGLLGEGRLTDAEGRLVDARSSLVVMTSNLGAGGGTGVGFRGPVPDFDGAVRRHFRPEFFNRIDYVVPFANLEMDALLLIVDLELRKASRRAGFVRRGLKVRATESARQRLAELGYDPKKGARPLKRVIEAKVVTPLAVRMAAEPSLKDRAFVLDASPDDAGGFTIRDQARAAFERGDQ